MATLNVDEIRSRLERERDRLRNDIATQASHRPESDGTPTESRYGNHVADEASDIFEDEKAIALQTHLTGVLSEVEHALRKIARGEFGRCENCGGEIAPERLEALPFVRHCITCQGRAESRREPR